MTTVRTKTISSPANAHPTQEGGPRTFPPIARHRGLRLHLDPVGQPPMSSSTPLCTVACKRTTRHEWAGAFSTPRSRRETPPSPLRPAKTLLPAHSLRPRAVCTSRTPPHRAASPLLHRHSIRIHSPSRETYTAAPSKSRKERKARADSRRVRDPLLAPRVDHHRGVFLVQHRLGVERNKNGLATS